MKRRFELDDTCKLLIPYYQGYNNSGNNKVMSIHNHPFDGICTDTIWDSNGMIFSTDLGSPSVTYSTWNEENECWINPDILTNGSFIFESLFMLPIEVNTKCYFYTDYVEVSPKHCDGLSVCINYVTGQEVDYYIDCGAGGSWTEKSNISFVDYDFQDYPILQWNLIQVFLVSTSANQGTLKVFHNSKELYSADNIYSPGYKNGMRTLEARTYVDTGTIKIGYIRLDGKSDNNPNIGDQVSENYFNKSSRHFSIMCLR